MKLWILEYGLDSYYLTMSGIVKDSLFSTKEKAEAEIAKLKKEGQTWLPEIKEISID